MSQRLAGKNAIITGAASGIGLASAQLFAAEGARVLAVDRPASGIAAMFADNAAIVPLACDLSAADAAATVLDAAMSRLGALDILFNNAGVVPVATVESMTDETWDGAMAINVNAVFRLCRAAIPALRSRAAVTGRGRIINTASIMAAFADYATAAYAASKHAVAGLTKALAMELGEFGITANYLLPGAILTGMTQNLFAVAEVRREWEQSAALKRLGQPIDIARAALLLASDEADFITGHGLVVDGGLSVHAGPLLPHQ